MVKVERKQHKREDIRGGRGKVGNGRMEMMEEKKRKERLKR